MNKKAQTNIDWEELIKLIIFLPILLAIIGVIFGTLNLVNQQNCPQCPTCENCSIYKNNIINLSEELKLCKNNSKEIVYINKTIEVPKIEIKELLVKEDTISGVTLLIISFVSSATLFILFWKFKFSLFKIEIKLSEETEKRFKHLTLATKIIKWTSFSISILILIKLLLILFSK